MTAARVLWAMLLTAVATAPAAAHHTGVYTPKDNAITENFKQVKFSAQAGKFDVALRLYDAGPLRAEMRNRAASLPEGLEGRTRAALVAGRPRGARPRPGHLLGGACARPAAGGRPPARGRRAGGHDRPALSRSDLALLQPRRLRGRPARRARVGGDAVGLRRRGRGCPSRLRRSRRHAAA